MGEGPAPPCAPAHAPFASLAGLDDALLEGIAGHLERRDLPALFAACRATAGLAGCERLWQRLWPWGGGCAADAPAQQRECAWPLWLKRLHAAQHRPPFYAASWRDAHRLCVELYRGGRLEPLLRVGAVPSPRALGGDVTCPHYTGRYRVYGHSDGLVRVFGPSGGNDDGDAAEAPARDFLVPGGSVRHMQLVQQQQQPATRGAARSLAAAAAAAAPRPPLLYVGSWGGCVHVIDLATGGVTELVACLGGPVYGLRISGDRLFTCCGDAAIYVWDARAAPATFLCALRGHASAVTDFTVQLQPPRPALPTVDAARSGAAARRPPLPALTRRVVSASYDGSVRVWHVTEPAHASFSAPVPAAAASEPLHHPPVAPCPVPAGNRRRSGSASGSNDTGGDGTSAGAGSSSSGRVISAACVAVLSGHRGPVWSVETAGRHVFSASADGTARVWRIDEPPPLGPSAGEVPPERACAQGGSGSGSGSGHKAGAPEPVQPPSPTQLSAECVRVLNPYAATALAHRHGQLWCVRVAGDVLLAGSSGGVIYCYDAASGAQLWAFQAGSARDGVRRLDLVRESLLVCTSRGRVGSFRFVAGGGAAAAATAAAAASAAAAAAAGLALDSEYSYPLDGSSLHAGPEAYPLGLGSAPLRPEAYHPHHMHALPMRAHLRAGGRGGGCAEEAPQPSSSSSSSSSAPREEAGGRGCAVDLLPGASDAHHGAGRSGGSRAGIGSTSMPLPGDGECEGDGEGGPASLLAAAACEPARGAALGRGGLRCDALGADAAADAGGEDDGAIETGAGAAAGMQGDGSDAGLAGYLSPLRLGSGPCANLHVSGGGGGGGGGGGSQGRSPGSSASSRSSGDAFSSG